ncbi:exopolyphosphatase [Corynebacterium sp.]|uniref:exopolyphosphatase n=1 Tax=Corynebacterium sp. TaxID=1720 RepID=UPI0026DAB083|nr:exopolyphosphatase [Corynebacterium sp.]MDO5032113.1 exopolyphosphatase [Corynebacterium sp.]
MSDSYFDGSSYAPETVRYFDVAHEGAQVRLMASAVEDLAELLGGSRPRSLVILPTDHIARATAHFAAGLAEPAQVPIVVAESLPQFCGALDVVVVIGESGEAEWASRALITAAARGASTVLVGPTRGPLVEDAPEETWQAPTLPTAEGSSPARYITALHAIYSVLTEDPVLVTRRLEEVAEAVDRELALLTPEHDATTNPGRVLREFVEGAFVVHSCGVDRYLYSEQRARVDMGALVARMAAAVWTVHGLGGTVVDAQELPGVLERHRESAPAAERDIFFDPQIDGDGAQGPLVPLKIVLWGQEEANLPHALAVSSADTEPALGDLARALQLITRSYAATAYDTQ